jgi:hypothetical protein
MPVYRYVEELSDYVSKEKLTFELGNLYGKKAQMVIFWLFGT